MQRQMSLKRHYLENGIKDAFEMQIRRITCIPGAGINSKLAGCVVLALDVCVFVSLCVSIRIPAWVCQ